MKLLAAKHADSLWERPRSTLGQSLLQDHLNAIEVEELDMEDFEREDDDLEEGDVNSSPSRQCKPSHFTSVCQSVCMYSLTTPLTTLPSGRSVSSPEVAAPGRGARAHPG